MRAIASCVTLAVLIASAPARAFATFAIESIYSNADGGMLLHERRFGPDATPLGETRLVL